MKIYIICEWDENIFVTTDYNEFIKELKDGFAYEVWENGKKISLEQQINEDLKMVR